MDRFPAARAEKVLGRGLADAALVAASLRPDRRPAAQRAAP
jgi:hypothetical protein